MEYKKIELLDQLSNLSKRRDNLLEEQIVVKEKLLDLHEDFELCQRKINRNMNKTLGLLIELNNFETDNEIL